MIVFLKELSSQAAEAVGRPRAKSTISTGFKTLIETDMFSANEIDPCLGEILPND